MITKNRFFRKDSKEAIFLSLYPLLFFSLPTQKFLRGQGEKYTRAGK